MASTTTTSLKLDEFLKQKVQRLAAARKRTPHWIMREAVAQYVEREEKREEFYREALDAWEEYKATGLHVTAEEADAWMAKMEAGESAEAPDCHG